MAESAAHVVSPPPYATDGSNPIFEFSEQDAKVSRQYADGTLNSQNLEL